ncbi:MAG TPA: GNAT family N-acetyltransferase [Streptosporangiaceae bacterium]|nr:GNAT family N-acetyltransferase [Streptosporangiaceae bacterium]
MPVSIETGRMLLRQMTGRDLDWLARLHGDRRVMRYIGDGEPVPRTEIPARTLPAMLREYDELPAGLGYFAAVERAAGRPLGWIGLRPPDSVGLCPPANTGLCPPAGVAELGYRLLPEVWGLGYATEGSRALIRHGFASLDLTSIVATTMTLNMASRRVLEKAGLSLARTFLAVWPSYLEGAEHGDVEYAIVRSAWRVRHLPAELA